MSGLKSVRSRGISGGASASMRGKKMGGRFGEKNMLIMKKDMEKKIQKALEKAGRDLTEN